MFVYIQPNSEAELRCSPCPNLSIDPLRNLQKWRVSTSTPDLVLLHPFLNISSCRARAHGYFLYAIMPMDEAQEMILAAREVAGPWVTCWVKSVAWTKSASNCHRSIAPRFFCCTNVKCMIQVVWSGFAAWLCKHANSKPQCSTVTHHDHQATWNHLQTTTNYQPFISIFNTLSNHIPTIYNHY